MKDIQGRALSVSYYQGIESTTRQSRARSRGSDVSQSKEFGGKMQYDFKALAASRWRYRAGVVAAFVAVSASAATLPDPLQAGWQGQSVCEHLHEDARQRVLRCTFAPTVGHERHFHAAHFGYTIAGGRMRITDASGTREVDVPTGSNFSSAGVNWHEVLNIGDTTAVFLIIEPK